MMGWLGAGALAAHQIAITCAATTFMIRWDFRKRSLFASASARSCREARYLPIIFGAWGITASIMAIFAALLVKKKKCARTAITTWFVENPAVTMLAAQLLPIAGCFRYSTVSRSPHPGL